MNTDQDILSSFASGQKEKAMRMLMSTYQERLYSHIRRMLWNHGDTDDTLQNTFIKAWKGLDRFRGDSSLHTWLYRIATNESLTLLEKRKRKPTIAINEEVMALAGNSLGPSAKEIRERLDTALQTLPPKQLVVFNMKYFDEMKYEEISAVTGTSVGALKSSYHIAVKKIEAFLSDED